MWKNLDGPYVQYDAEGNICVECLYVDGKREGPYNAFWPNGAVKTEATYINDRLEGTIRRWDKDGHLYCEYQVSNGVLQRGVMPLFNL
jgi:uncharacterized protein